MDLKAKAIKSTAWYVGTRVWIQALSWGVTIVLARILAPSDYGLFAMAFTVITFIELFQEFGLGVSIVQRRNLSEQQINAIFWILCGVSFTILAVTFLSAGWVAGFYQEPRLTWIIRFLSLTFLFNSLGVVPYSLLTREIDFKHRSLAEATGVVISAATSLAMAYLDYGIWALVVGQLVRAAVRNLAMFVSSRWIPSVDISFAEMGEILRFSLHMAGASAMGTLADTATTAIVGKFLGGYNLGLYSMAAALGKNNPLHKLSTGVINQLSLPVFSKLQNELEVLQEYFLKITRYLAVISLPMQLGMAFVARDLVLILLSEKWLPIVGFLQVFSLTGIFHIVTLPAAPLLTARGRADLNIRFSSLYFLMTSAAYLVGARWGLAGIATGWLIVFPLLRLYLLWLGLKEVNLSTVSYFKNLATPALAAGVMGIVLVALPVITDDFHLVERLASSVVLGAATYVCCLLAIDRKLGEELKTMATEIFAVSRQQTSRVGEG
jgi:teichuronic acid exporter